MQLLEKLSSNRIFNIKSRLFPLPGVYFPTISIGCSLSYSSLNFMNVKIRPPFGALNPQGISYTNCMLKIISLQPKLPPLASSPPSFSGNRIANQAYSSRTRPSSPTSSHRAIPATGDLPCYSAPVVRAQRLTWHHPTAHRILLGC